MRSAVRALFTVIVAAPLLSAVPRQEASSAAPRPDSKSRPAAKQASPLPWWKGNLHAHSLWSDGDDFPDMIADWYYRRDYHFLCLSEHNVLPKEGRWLDIASSESPPAETASAKTARQDAVKKYLERFGPSWVELRTEGGRPQARLKPPPELRRRIEQPNRFLLLPAEEITQQSVKTRVHIGVINPREVIKPIDGDTVAETIRANLRSVWIQQQQTGWPMIAIVNHPNDKWGIRAEDMLSADEMGFFEVYNGHPSVRNGGDDLHPGCERLWDIVLAVRLGVLKLPPVYGVATDDAHEYHELGMGKVNPGRGWVMVQAPELSPNAIVQALKAGRFYSSTGVVLNDLRRNGKQLSLTIRGEEGVTYKTQFIATLRDATLTSTLRLDADGKPLNVTAVYSDEVGKVVAESDGLQPSYELTGRELYVRAKVNSSKPHPNPSERGAKEVAWTQPIVP